MKITDYPPLNFAPIQRPRVVVVCESEEEALHLLAAMKTQHPEKCTSWNFPNVYWDRYKEREIAYNCDLDNGYGCMAYSSTEWYAQRGYEFVLFYELLIQDEDFDGDIDEADLLSLLE